MKKGFLSGKQKTAPEERAKLGNVQNGYSKSPAAEHRPSAKLTQCSNLLEARRISAALRALGASSDAVELRHRCEVLSRKAKTKATEALEKGRPIEALLSLFCSGIEELEESDLWGRVNGALRSSLGKFQAMLLEVGAISPSSLLLVEPAPVGGLQVLLFQGASFGKAGEWHSLPATYTEAMAQVSQKCAAEASAGACVLSGAAWSTPAPFDEEMWPSLSQGDWLELDRLAHHQEERQGGGGDWPAVRWGA